MCLALDLYIKKCSGKVSINVTTTCADMAPW